MGSTMDIVDFLFFFLERNQKKNIEKTKKKISESRGMQNARGGVFLFRLRGPF